MTSILQAMGYIQDQADAGQKKGLARLLGSAYGAAPEQRQQILGTVAQRGGLSEAMAADKGFGEQEDNVHLQMAKRAREVVALYKANPQMAQQIYQNGLVPLAARAGVTNPPPQLDDTLIPGLEKLASAAVDKSSELQTFDAMSAGLTPEQIAEARQINLGLKPRAVTAAAKSLSVDINGVPTQLTFNPATGTYEQAVVGGGPSPAPAPSAGGDIFSGLTSAVPGLTITSAQRSPEHNREVGGVPNSYHLTGQARDILPPNAQQAPMVRQWAAANGMEVLNEGDHWHLEPRKGAPIVGRTKEAEAYAVDSAKNQAQIDALPTIGGLEATNAGRKEMAVAAAQTATGAGVEAAKQFGQDAAKTFGAIQDSGRAAAKERSRLALLRADLKNTYTGPGANMLLGIKRAANAFGIKVDGLAEGEAARALSNQLALSLRNPAGGEGMPGAMSDADRNFLMQSVPGLLSSPQGWRAMVDMRLALADAAVKQAQYAEQLRRQGVPIQDIPGRVQDFANQNQIFNAGQQAAPSAPAAGGWKVEVVQ